MELRDHQNYPTVVIYGGNGFVGTRVAKLLSSQQVNTVCVSRSGHRPLYLKNEKWSESVRWCAGDASDPCTKLLGTASAIITLVGSPPLPTWSQTAYQEQLFMNGNVNVEAIQAASEAGVKRAVLLSAKIPSILQSNRFAYAKGKRLAEQAAKNFAAISSEHTAVVIQPSIIVGRRYLKDGKAIPLDVLMGPAARLLPSRFVLIERVAARIVDAALAETPYAGEYTEIPSEQI